MHLKKGILALALIGVNLLACERTRTGPQRSPSGNPIPAGKTLAGDDSGIRARKNVRIVGAFAPEELDSIRRIIKQEDPSPVMSIVRADTTVKVTTCEDGGWPCGHGRGYTLEKVDQKWVIKERTWWES